MNASALLIVASYFLPDLPWAVLVTASCSSAITFLLVFTLGRADFFSFNAVTTSCLTVEFEIAANSAGSCSYVSVTSDPFYPYRRYYSTKTMHTCISQVKLSLIREI